MEKSFFQKIHEWVVVTITPIRWKQRSQITSAQKEVIREKLTHDYFIIATRRRNYLTTFFIGLGHFLLTGKWGHYSHVLMNLEDEVHSDSDFRLIEATTKGTIYSTFEKVFDRVDSVALIKPHSMTVEEWTKCMDAAKEHLGKPYDNLFNIKNDMEINCVELVRIALSALPDYRFRFANFENMIARKNNITPQMFLDCPDFHVYAEFKA